MRLLHTGVLVKEMSANLRSLSFHQLASDAHPSTSFVGECCNLYLRILYQLLIYILVFAGHEIHFTVDDIAETERPNTWLITIHSSKEILATTPDFITFPCHMMAPTVLQGF